MPVPRLGGSRAAHGIAALMLAAVLAAAAPPATSAPGLQQAPRATQHAGPPAPTGLDIAYRPAGRDNHRRPCPPVEVLPPGRDPDGDLALDSPLLAGGCQATVTGRSRMTIITAIGAVRFATCDIAATMHIDRTGHAKLGEIGFTGEIPCNDSGSCYTESGRPEPTTAQLKPTSDGTLRLHTHLCLDTCMGRFAGPTQLRLTPTAPQRLQLDIEHHTPGTSGWQLTGDWALHLRHPLQISTSPRKPADRAMPSAGG